MKYTTEIEIERPIDKVIELFDNADSLKKWMEGLTSALCFSNLYYLINQQLSRRMTSRY